MSGVPAANGAQGGSKHKGKLDSLIRAIPDPEIDAKQHCSAEKQEGTVTD